MALGFVLRMIRTMSRMLQGWDLATKLTIKVTILIIASDPN